ncbi:hypothetical protein FNV43_RR18995 [Rhamnella rubrinervis]|uniref:Uncharacterized protein n=1 Tax=Rhamnella rubrinervis TaxID=2594499 RepID=A0A8K0GW47_9ROSA|nr:hypothetical protein FNV43_RR18995 [Rhamnella rubrinervis]
MFEEICKRLDLRRVMSVYDPESICDQCMCSRSSRGEADDEFDMEDEECPTSEEEGDMSFCIGDDEISDAHLASDLLEYVCHNVEKSLEIQDGIFSWDPESTINQPLLEINLKVGLGQKIAVFGSVGAGKSSLLYATLFNDCIMTALGKKTVI